MVPTNMAVNMDRPVACSSPRSVVPSGAASRELAHQSSLGRSITPQQGTSVGDLLAGTPRELARQSLASSSSSPRHGVRPRASSPTVHRVATQPAIAHHAVAHQSQSSIARSPCQSEAHRLPIPSVAVQQEGAQHSLSVGLPSPRHGSSLISRAQQEIVHRGIPPSVTTGTPPASPLFRNRTIVTTITTGTPPASPLARQRGVWPTVPSTSPVGSPSSRHRGIPQPAPTANSLGSPSSGQRGISPTEPISAPAASPLLQHQGIPPTVTKVQSGSEGSASAVTKVPNASRQALLPALTENTEMLPTRLADAGIMTEARQTLPSGTSHQVKTDAKAGAVAVHADGEKREPGQSSTETAIFKAMEDLVARKVAAAKVNTNLTGTVEKTEAERMNSFQGGADLESGEAAESERAAEHTRADQQEAEVKAVVATDDSVRIESAMTAGEEPTHMIETDHVALEAMAAETTAVRARANGFANQIADPESLAAEECKTIKRAEKKGSCRRVKVAAQAGICVAILLLFWHLAASSIRTPSAPLPSPHPVLPTSKDTLYGKTKQEKHVHGFIGAKDVGADNEEAERDKQEKRADGVSDGNAEAKLSQQKRRAASNVPEKIPTVTKAPNGSPGLPNILDDKAQQQKTLLPNTAVNEGTEAKRTDKLSGLPASVAVKQGKEAKRIDTFPGQTSSLHEALKRDVTSKRTDKPSGQKDGVTIGAKAFSFFSGTIAFVLLVAFCYRFRKFDEDATDAAGLCDPLLLANSATDVPNPSGLPPTVNHVAIPSAAPSAMLGNDFAGKAYKTTLSPPPWGPALKVWLKSTTMTGDAKAPSIVDSGAVVGSTQHISPKTTSRVSLPAGGHSGAESKSAPAGGTVAPISSPASPQPADAKAASIIGPRGTNVKQVTAPDLQSHDAGGPCVTISAAVACTSVDDSRSAADSDDLTLASIGSASPLLGAALLNRAQFGSPPAVFRQAIEDHIDPGKVCLQLDPSFDVSQEAHLLSEILCVPGVISANIEGSLAIVIARTASIARDDAFHAKLLAAAGGPSNIALVRFQTD